MFMSDYIMYFSVIYCLIFIALCIIIYILFILGTLCIFFCNLNLNFWCFSATFSNISAISWRPIYKAGCEPTPYW